MYYVDNLIISGASVTNSPWFTWANHAEEYLQPKTVTNLSIKGCGNKFVALSLINHLLNSEIRSNTLVMPMFTCVDKLDLYVGPAQAHKLCNEKHPPINLDAEYCKDKQPGFWSTGSHFPGIKELYEKHFLDLDWMTTDTIFTIYNLIKVCDSLKVGLICLFDGDIWNHTERDYNQMVMGGTCEPRRMLDGELAARYKNLLPDEIKQVDSLFEYALNKKLPIYNSICKLHPPSDVHLLWFNELILPKIKFKIHALNQSYLSKVKKFSDEWHNQNF